jgi:hypothetical protein
MSKISLNNIWNPAPWFFRLFFDNTWRLIRRNSAWTEQAIWVQT